MIYTLSLLGEGWGEELASTGTSRPFFPYASRPHSCPFPSERNRKLPIDKFLATSLYFMNNENRKRVRVRLKPDYDIIVGHGILESVDPISRTALGETCRRVVIISNQKVFGLYGRRLGSGLSDTGFHTKVFLLGDGERHKSFRSLQRVLSFLATLGLERSDAVIALGGGVVGDLAGLAAALYMRGIAFIQVPTTLLAQIDASVGGKTAVNLPQGKNLVGAFHQPRAVIIDIETLATLPKRELTSGWCEAIKQSAVASRSLFKETRRVLSNGQHDAKYEEQLESIGPIRIVDARDIPRRVVSDSIRAVLQVSG